MANQRYSRRGRKGRFQHDRVAREDIQAQLAIHEAEIKEMNDDANDAFGPRDFQPEEKMYRRSLDSAEDDRR